MAKNGFVGKMGKEQPGKLFYVQKDHGGMQQAKENDPSGRDGSAGEA